MTTTSHRRRRRRATVERRSVLCSLLGACCLSLLVEIRPSPAAETDARAADTTVIRRPLGPAELPDSLPGRWKIMLCVADDDGHAWIRFENPDNGEVRSIGRYHLLVGGWFDRRKFHWNYAPTFRTGLYMDREQRREPNLADGSEILRTAWVDDPQIFTGDHPRGHALVRNNCATYARDAWSFYTGEYWELPVIHSPKTLREAVGREHPEVLTVGRRARK